MKLSKCHNKPTCKTPEEIDAFVENLIMTNFIWEPSID